MFNANADASTPPCERSQSPARSSSSVTTSVWPRFFRAARRASSFPACVQARAVVEQERHHIQATATSRPLQRAVVFVVDIGSASEQQRRSRHVTGLRCMQTREHRHCCMRPCPAVMSSQQGAPCMQPFLADERSRSSYRRLQQADSARRRAARRLHPAAFHSVRPSLPPFMSRSRSSRSSRRASASISRMISGGSQGRGARPSELPSLAGSPPPWRAVLQQPARPELSG